MPELDYILPGKWKNGFILLKFLSCIRLPSLFPPGFHGLREKLLAACLLKMESLAVFEIAAVGELEPAKPVGIISLKS